MVYVSSSVLPGTTIEEAAEFLTNKKICAIEWSGGHQVSPDYRKILLALTAKGLRSRVHNYFPPPTEDFVFNLASDSETIAGKSIEMVTRNILLSSEIGADKFGIHAGFFFDPEPWELGKKMDTRKTFHRELGLKRFVERFLKLEETARRYGVKLYVENNVVNRETFMSIQKQKPFMLLDMEDWYELKQMGVNNLLLDIAHLFVTSCTLSLEYAEQSAVLFDESDYIHLSSNSGEVDSNGEVTTASMPLFPLVTNDWTKKDVTVEVYDSVDAALRSARAVEALQAS